MEPYRIYIDESGDHTYRNLTETDYAKRYLGLTGVLVRTDFYVDRVQPALEKLKRDHFRHDPDNTDWTFLHRDDIVKRHRAFGVLREPPKNDAWEAAVLDYFTNLPVLIYTVVVDKWELKQRYGPRAYEPYHFSLAVLLNRIRGFLYFYRNGATADVIIETRGWRKTDVALQKQYTRLRTVGSGERPAEEYEAAYPCPQLDIRKKSENIGGLQVADLVASEQKQQTLIENQLPISRPLSPFQTKMIAAVEPKVILPYGRVLIGKTDG